MSFVDYALWVYAYIVVDGLLGVLFMVGIAGTILLAFGIVFTIFADDFEIDEDSNFQKIRTTLINSIKYLTVPALLVGSLVDAFYPEKEDLMYIVGGATVLSGGQYMVNSEEAQQLPDNVLEAANKFLADFTDEPKEEQTDETD